jgi:hypothetical protein
MSGSFLFLTIQLPRYFCLFGAVLGIYLGYHLLIRGVQGCPNQGGGR